MNNLDVNHPGDTLDLNHVQSSRLILCCLSQQSRPNSPNKSTTQIQQEATIWARLGQVGLAGSDPVTERGNLIPPPPPLLELLHSCPSALSFLPFKPSPGVLVLSWYPPGVADDHGGPTEDLVPAVMDAAHRHSIKVTGETGFFLLSDVSASRLSACETSRPGCSQAGPTFAGLIDSIVQPWFWSWVAPLPRFPSMLCRSEAFLFLMTFLKVGMRESARDSCGKGQILPPTSPRMKIRVSVGDLHNS